MKRLYVGNIAYKTSEEALKDAFSAIASVTSVKIITDKFSGESRGFGFVDLLNDEEAEQVIEALNGMELDGKVLVVNEARSRENGKHSERKREGGRGYGNRSHNRNNFRNRRKEPSKGQRS